MMSGLLVILFIAPAACLRFQPVAQCGRRAAVLGVTSAALQGTMGTWPALAADGDDDDNWAKHIGPFTDAEFEGFTVSKAPPPRLPCGATTHLRDVSCPDP
jgi:hypothetical protein